MWWNTPLIPEFGKQRRVDLEFKVRLFNIRSSRPVRVTKQDLASKKFSIENLSYMLPWEKNLDFLSLDA